ncbi:hypothetical protein APHAL10511_004527 [Amanita phalloides]|nr:hypothetical protein APHAL10511_004527 [Amanita phalloides]
MYSTLFSHALFAATAVSGVLATFSIETPNLTQCQGATISWSPGVPPYYVVVVNPNDPCGEPMLDLGTFSVTSFTWNVAVPSGTLMELYVEDSGDNDAWGGRVTVSKSDDSSCLSQAALSSPTPTPSTSPSSNHDKDHDSTPSPNPSPSDPPTGLVPVGAANAGTNPLSSGASSMHRAGAPIATIFATFVAAIALAL